MRKTLSIISTILIFSACEKNVKNTSVKEELQLDTIVSSKKITDSKVCADKVCIGMTIQQMKSLYENANFVEEPVYEYGIDGESNGIVIEDKGVRMLFVWTLEGDDKIRGITVLSDQIIIDKDVHIGMRADAFLSKYPNGIFHIDMIDDNYEYIYVPSVEYIVQFLTTDSTRIANYDYDQSEPEFIKIKRPEAKIERISL